MTAIGLVFLALSTRETAISRHGPTNGPAWTGAHSFPALSCLDLTCSVPVSMFAFTAITTTTTTTSSSPTSSSSSSSSLFICMHAWPCLFSITPPSPSPSSHLVSPPIPSHPCSHSSIHLGHHQTSSITHPPTCTKGSRPTRPCLASGQSSVFLFYFCTCYLLLLFLLACEMRPWMATDCLASSFPFLSRSLSLFLSLSLSLSLSDAPHAPFLKSGPNIQFSTLALFPSHFAFLLVFADPLFFVPLFNIILVRPLISSFSILVDFIPLGAKDSLTPCTPLLLSHHLAAQMHLKKALLLALVTLTFCSAIDILNPFAPGDPTTTSGATSATTTTTPPASSTTTTPSASTTPPPSSSDSGSASTTPSASSSSSSKASATKSSSSASGTNMSSSSTPSATNPPAADTGKPASSAGLVTGAIVVGSVVVAAAIGIWIFRKWKLSPSRDFQSKIRGDEYTDYPQTYGGDTVHLHSIGDANAANAPEPIKSPYAATGAIRQGGQDDYYDPNYVQDHSQGGYDNYGGQHGGAPAYSNYDQGGYDQSGYNQHGYDQHGYDHQGNQQGYNGGGGSDIGAAPYGNQGGYAASNVGGPAYGNQGGYGNQGYGGRY